MMFEGAVMATIQELGGDYGLQRWHIAIFLCFWDADYLYQT